MHVRARKHSFLWCGYIVALCTLYMYILEDCRMYRVQYCDGVVGGLNAFGWGSYGTHHQAPFPQAQHIPSPSNPPLSDPLSPHTFSLSNSLSLSLSFRTSLFHPPSLSSSPPWREYNGSKTKRPTPFCFNLLTGKRQKISFIFFFGVGLRNAWSVWWARLRDCLVFNN